MIKPGNRFLKPRFEWKPRHKADHPLSEGLVAHWLTNEGTGSTLYDLTRSYDASMSGFNFTSSSGWTEGRNGSALLFDGSNDYASLASLDLTNTDKMSLSFWIKWSSVNTPILLEYSTSYAANNAFVLDLNDGALGRILLADHTTSGYNSAFTSGSYNDGKWHHVVATIDRGLGVYQNSLYVDGAYDTIQSPNYTADINGNFGGPYPFYIGSRAGGGYFFSGGLEDIRLYKRALTRAEARWLYEEPFADIECQIQRKWWFVPGAAAAFNPAWAKGSNVILKTGALA